MTISGLLRLLTSLLLITLSSQHSSYNDVTLSHFLTPAIARQDDDDDDDDGTALINLGELLIPAFAVGIVSVDGFKLTYFECRSFFRQP